MPCPLPSREMEVNQRYSSTFSEVSENTKGFSEISYIKYNKLLGIPSPFLKNLNT